MFITRVPSVILCATVALCFARNIPGAEPLTKPAKITFDEAGAHYSEEEDATLFDHLGDIYAVLGRQDKAREAWKKSLSLEPNEQVRKKLELQGK